MSTDTTKVQRRLLKLQREMQTTLKRLREQLATYQNGASAASHQADIAQGSEERETLRQQIDCLENTLASIQSALDKINQGTYGFCTCKNPIQPERLEAQPYALLCLRCQEAAEKKAARPRRRE